MNIMQGKSESAKMEYGKLTISPVLVLLFQVSLPKYNNYLKINSPMKFSNVPLLFILIVIFMIFSGCISTPPLKETSLNPIGTLVHGYDLFDNTEFGWYYYQINTKSITNGLGKVDMKTNVSREIYNGTPAIHYVSENTFEKLNTNEITYLFSDVYLDENLKILGGYAKGVENGKEENITITPDINPVNPVKIDGFWWTIERPFFKNSSGYVFEGSEPITVGAGSFPNALHYTSVDYMGEWDYWIAPGVPLFVKATLHSPEVEMYIDLISWGEPVHEVATVPQKIVSQLTATQPPIFPVSNLAPLPSETDIDFSALNQLILQNTDFSVVVIKNTNFTDPTGSPFHYAQEIILDKDSGRVIQNIGIADTKANASILYDQIDKKMAPMLISPLIKADNVSVGDRGKIYVFKNQPPKNSRGYFLFFSRGNVFEIIIVDDIPEQSLKEDNLIFDLAEKADRKILLAMR
jgi:hypothetical protein